jgi:hypothetical protein
MTSMRLWGGVAYCRTNVSRQRSWNVLQQIAVRPYILDRIFTLSVSSLKGFRPFSNSSFTTHHDGRLRDFEQSGDITVTCTSLAVRSGPVHEVPSTMSGLVDYLSLPRSRLAVLGNKDWFKFGFKLIRPRGCTATVPNSHVAQPSFFDIKGCVFYAVECGCPCLLYPKPWHLPSGSTPTNTLSSQ